MIRFHPDAPPVAPLEREVVSVWRASGRTLKTIAQYVVWPRRFYAHCARAEVDPVRELTLAGAVRFSRAHVGQRTGRHLSGDARVHALVALRARSCALRVLGQTVPEWMPPPACKALSGLLAEYHEHRLRHCGVSASTLRKDADTASQFLAFLRSRRRTVMRARVADLDIFVAMLARRLARKTVSMACSTLRCFLRFLQSSGRLRHDLASSVVAPRAKPMEQPPRALPWPAIRRLVRGVKRDRPGGRRDYALLLLMATYGLGAGEVMNLHLDDIDWANSSVRVRRPKTGVSMLLPLLPAVARALAAYIERERPHHAASREVFVSKAMPHRRISSSSSILYLVQKHARAAGIKAEYLGSHVLRHSHACRQIDAGASPKVLGDILGHRHPSSTSAYVRVAFKRLRQVGLPVPR